MSKNLLCKFKMLGYASQRYSIALGDRQSFLTIQYQETAEMRMLRVVAPSSVLALVKDTLLHWFYSGEGGEVNNESPSLLTSP